MIFSTLTVGHFLDWCLVRRTRKGAQSIECQLPPVILGSAPVSLGVLSFGWTVQYKLQWFVPILFLTLVGYGYGSIDISAWSYLVDAFGIYSASATAATVLLRNAVSAGLSSPGLALVSKVD